MSLTPRLHTRTCLTGKRKDTLPLTSADSRFQRRDQDSIRGARPPWHIDVEQEICVRCDRKSVALETAIGDHHNIFARSVCVSGSRTQFHDGRTIAIWLRRCTWSVKATKISTCKCYQIAGVLDFRHQFLPLHLPAVALKIS